MLMSSRTTENGGYLDFRSLGTDDLSAIIAAADDAYLLADKEGPRTFYDPAAFRGFLEQLRASYGRCSVRD